MVPGAGPALEDNTWRVAKHPRHRRRKKPYLTDNVQLGRAFRKFYLRGLKRLLQTGKLQIGGRVSFLQDRDRRKQWLDELEAIDWNVFIQGPPGGQSDPAQVVKYLARYLTGGPIADRRLIRADENEVVFWARPKKPANSSKQNRTGMAKPKPFRLTGRQFMQRWAMHILPRGFVRSRCYGGYHGKKRSDYLIRCTELLKQRSPETGNETCSSPAEPADRTSLETEPPIQRCPHCRGELTLLQRQRRPSWREIFEPDYRPVRSCPDYRLVASRPPPD